MDGLWEKANQVSEIGYKIHSVSNVIEMLAEAISHDVNSGAAWAAAEMVKHYSEQLEKLSEELMAMNRGDEEAKITKGKKK